MNPHQKPGLFFAVHPTSHGFGWAIFEAPDAPVTWGITAAKESKNEHSMKRFQKLVERYHPSALLLEAFGEEDSARNERIRTLADTMRGYAQAHGMDVAVYDRKAVGRALLGRPAATRHEIAEAVGERFPFLLARLPQRRRLWHSERAAQCLFDAVALGLTHFALTKQQR